MRFAINDKIVYPMHGAGVIERIEKVEILGELKDYYVLRVPCGDMKIMIPLETSDTIGIRPVVPAETANLALAMLAEPETEMSSNWNRRYRENVAKLKSGDIFAVAEVMRNLGRMDKERKLSTGEKKLLTTARQILASELCLALGQSEKEIERQINEAI